MIHQLLFRSPTGERTARLDRPIVVGRDAACDVVVDSVRVSRRHAEFLPSGDGVMVRDLGSRNGVIVNGTRVEQASVGPADRVLLGDVSVVVQTLGADVARTSQPIEPPPAAGSVASAPLAPPRAPVVLAPPPPFSPAISSQPFPPSPGPNPFGAPVGPSPFGQAPAVVPAPGPSPLVPPLAASQAGWPVAGGLEANPDKTTILPAGGMAAAAPAQSRGKTRVGTTATGGPRRSLVGRLGIGARITVIVTTAALGAALAGFIPLLLARNAALSTITRLRVATIARALAVEVGPALASGQTTALGVGAAMSEPGVRQALILAPDGRVLAPPERLDERLTELPVFGPVASLRGAQTVMVEREAQATVEIDSGGRRVGLVWVRLDPAYQSAGSGAGLYLVTAVFMALVLGFGAGHFVRKLVWGRLQTLATDVDLASSGQLASVSEPFGVPRLAESINFIVGRLRTGPAPSAGPSLAAPAPPASSGKSPQPGGGGTLVLNPAYVIQDALGAAPAFLESTPDRLIGHHVIEAITDQALVSAILDCTSELGARDTATRLVDATDARPRLELQATRGADGMIHVALRAQG